MNNKNNINCNNCPQSCPVLSRPSFHEAVSRAEMQLDIQYAGKDVYMLHELCRIMAEVYLMNPNTPIRISGELLEAYIVQQVFGELDSTHAEYVIANFKSQTALIKNKKAYLRTALYNSVFEIEAHYTNLVAHEFQ